MGNYKQGSIRIDYDRRDQNQVNGKIWANIEDMPYYDLEKNYSANTGSDWMTVIILPKIDIT